MNHTENEFTILKTHENSINSSINGDMIELLQLCQNNNTKVHYYTYEVLDSVGGIIGGRLIYEFKKPDQALVEWDNFIGDGLKPSAKFSVTKDNFPQGKKSKFS